jgi:hypothetical protein
MADSQGPHLPEDGYLLRKSVARLANARYVSGILEGKELWPPDELLSVIGLAQHHGLPTRLLDWTRDPYIAAYFAAMSAMRKEANGTLDYSEQLAVWVFNLDMKRVLTRQIPNGWSETNECGYKGLRDDVVLVTAPAALNSRRKAQRGLFTLVRPTGSASNTSMHNVALDEYVVKDFPPGFSPDTQLFWRINVSVRFCKEVLNRLIRLDYTTARLFPGFDGVIDSLRHGGVSDMGTQITFLDVET